MLCFDIIIQYMRVCWNRQTGTFEGRVSLAYGFKSHHSHQNKIYYTVFQRADVPSCVNWSSQLVTLVCRSVQRNVLCYGGPEQTRYKILSISLFIFKCNSHNKNLLKIYFQYEFFYALIVVVLLKKWMFCG